jgi:tetratricopeptide (TPR) repeat protein
MAEVLLTHAVNQAEEAIESGNYGGAIETCQRILGQFPEFAGAHRIIGDAYAEQGQHDAAREAYQRTLERDPQSIPAYLGLGVLAEDVSELETGLAYFQVAWEIDPRRRDLREHVSRISQQLYGADGRLYLTRAALTSLHFHAGRWDRAVSEAAQVLHELPSRIDVQVRLAESLWRRGDDQQSRQVCTTVLRSLPQAVVPLLILADIHRREGDNAGAGEFLQEARNIDPVGVRAADLIIVGLDDQADFLAVEDVPTIDDQLVIEEPAQYAPAPDFTSFDSREAQPADDLMAEVSERPVGAPDLSDLDTSGVQPFRWEDIGDEDLEASDIHGMAPPEDFAGADSFSTDEFTLPTDEELERARPSEEQPHGYTNMLESLDAEGVEAFDFSFGEESVGDIDDSLESETEFDWDNISMPTDEELDQARPKTDQLAGHTDMLESFDSSGVQPFDPFGDEQPAQAMAPSEDERVVSVDAETQLSGDQLAEQVGPNQEDLAEIDDWLSEFSLPSEEEIEEARPAAERPSGFTGMLESLDAEGVEPFDPLAGIGELDQMQGDRGPEESVLPDEEPVADVTDSALDLDELGKVGPFEIDWSSIDEEIEEAIPGEMPRGYTDQLRALDDVGMEPFSFEDGPKDDAEQVSTDEDVAAIDSDEVFDEWEEVARETDELTLPSQFAEPVDIESVDVFFEDELDVHFAPTEPLRSAEIEEEHPTASDRDVPLNGVEASDESWTGESLSSFFGEVDEDSGLDSAMGLLPDDFQASRPDVEGDHLVSSDVSRESFGGVNGITAERLGLDDSLIERARNVKQALVDTGQIAGSSPLGPDEPDVDVATIQERLESDPTNVDLRIDLAISLIHGDPDAALEQFRWIYRHAPEHGAEVVDDVVRLVDVMREREVGVHRLLGAIYRRHGDWAAASRHYEESLLGRVRRSSH